MTPEHLRILRQALMLLNEKPRFGPRDRRLAFDSYSTAADIQRWIEQERCDPYDNAGLPRN